MTDVQRPMGQRGAVASLGMVIALGWLALVLTMSGEHAHTMTGLDLPFLAMWGAMSVAMMLPTIAPLALAYAEVGPGHAASYVGGYLAVWIAIAPLAYALLAVMHNWVWLVAAWVVAGIWQAVPWTRTALQRCRITSNSDHAARSSGSLIAGVRQGAWCTVACLPIMVAGMATAMVVSPIAGTALMVLLTVFMIWEKRGARTAPTREFARTLRISAVAICVLGVGLIGVTAALTWAGQAPASSGHEHHHQS